MIVFLIVGCILFSLSFFILDHVEPEASISTMVCSPLLGMFFFTSQLLDGDKIRSFSGYFEHLNHLNTWSFFVASLLAGLLIGFVLKFGVHLYDKAEDKKRYYLEKDLAYLGFENKRDTSDYRYDDEKYTYKSNYYYKKDEVKPNPRIVARFAYNSPLFKAMLARKSINTRVISEKKKKEGFTGESLWEYKSKWNIWEAIRLEKRYQDKELPTSKYPLASYIYADTLVRTPGPVDKKAGKKIDWKRIEFFQRNNYEPGVVMQARNKTLEELNLVDGIPGDLAMEILG
jgi:hypothetical protein